MVGAHDGRGEPMALKARRGTGGIIGLYPQPDALDAIGLSKARQHFEEDVFKNGDVIAF